MAFNTLNYCLFLVTILMVTWSLARYRMLRLTILLLASYFFYMCSKPIYILLILGSTCVDYFCGKFIYKTHSKTLKKWLLATSLITNLGLLGTFKYYDFFTVSIQHALQTMGWLSPDTTLPLLQLMLPVGISFYTFQTMAYTIDVYRGRQIPIENPLKFALFVSFFPQLVAGPIVHARELVPQLERPPKITAQQVSDGVFLIIKGLIKKVAIADWLALNLVDRVYDNPGAFTSAEVMLALYAYSMQIYCDFSGYTDLAIGSGKMFGYELPKNFDRPYMGTSVAKFWRRWHMTLSRWVREYIYFPLGGTHKGERRAYLNIMIALVAMGLWHGANWTFFWYGILHGVMVGINRYHNQKRKRLGVSNEFHGFSLVWRIFLAFNFVTIARILFRAPSMANAWEITQSLFTWNWGFGHIHWKIWAVLFVSYAIHWSPKGYVTMVQERFTAMPAWAQGLVMAIVGGWMVHLSNVQPVPFIYFQF
jgi:D-alanyl-lipoteichoic acid acyltransferase DltB (MBOAT superfamily)